MKKQCKSRRPRGTSEKMPIFIKGHSETEGLFLTLAFLVSGLRVIKNIENRAVEHYPFSLIVETDSFASMWKLDPVYSVLFLPANPPIHGVNDCTSPSGQNGEFVQAQICLFMMKLYPLLSKADFFHTVTWFSHCFSSHKNFSAETVVWCFGNCIPAKAIPVIVLPAVFPPLCGPPTSAFPG